MSTSAWILMITLQQFQVTGMTSMQAMFSSRDACIKALNEWKTQESMYVKGFCIHNYHGTIAR